MKRVAARAFESTKAARNERNEDKDEDTPIAGTNKAYTTNENQFRCFISFFISFLVIFSREETFIARFPSSSRLVVCSSKSSSSSIHRAVSQTKLFRNPQHPKEEEEDPVARRPFVGSRSDAIRNRRIRETGPVRFGATRELGLTVFGGRLDAPSRIDHLSLREF